MTLSTLLIKSTCRTHVSYNFVMCPAHQFLWLSGRALERLIRRSEIRFFVGTQKLSLFHSRDKTKNISLIFLTATVLKIISKQRALRLNVLTPRPKQSQQPIRKKWTSKENLEKENFHKKFALFTKTRANCFFVCCLIVWEAQVF